ncbi:MAG: glycosyltransferase [Proteobacteria bacterium]|nr:glycosyltransferase [Pseudomonadota bacterium]NBY19535.1 glycosyltransferase [bacterium]
MPHIEVILPIFNELNNIPILVERLDRVKTEMSHEASMSYLFINDGSQDGSTELLNQLHGARSDIRVIHLLHNFGHGPALACGVQYFRGDMAIFMDSDLQDPPEAIPEMYRAWKQGAKTVVAERKSREEKNKTLFNTFYFLLHKIAPSLPPINFGTHCLLDSTVIQRLKGLKEKNRYFPGLVGFASPKIESVSIHRNDRNHGKSRVGLKGLINLAITAFLSFSSTPVRIVSVMGLMASVVAILSGSVIVGIKLFTSLAIPGWASTMSTLAFGSGIQLLCLGIIGEYIARIYDEVKERPLYLVDEVLEQGSLKTRTSEDDIFIPKVISF